MAQQSSTSYVVYRTGSNAANQPLTFDPMPIGIYDGEGRTARERCVDACRRAEAEHTVYANQHLSARPASRVSRDEYDAAAETMDARRRENAYNEALAAERAAGNPHPGYACDAFCGCYDEAE